MSPARKAADSPEPAPPYVGCAVCGDMPDQCRAFWKGGDTVVDNIPASASKLLIVGAPFYNQDTGGSNWCLLQCPACGTYYDWDFEYEYLVNGSEDDVNITRLNADDGARKAALVAGHVAAGRARFAAESPPWADAMLHAQDVDQVRKAASDLYMAQSDGNDLTPILAELLEGMRRPESQGDATSTLSLAFFVYGSRSQANLDRLRAAIAAAGMESFGSLQTTLRSCESVLRGG